MNSRSRLVSLVTAVLLLVAVPALAKQAPGTYHGTTSQKLAMSIVVKKGAVTAMHFKVKNNCGAKHKPIDVTGGSTKIDAKGRFSVNLSNDRGSLKVSGVFKGTKATGTLREQAQDPVIVLKTCDTGKVHWSIKL